MTRVLVRGAGVAGLCCAYRLLRAGVEVQLDDPGGIPGRGASYLAGGMLAPHSELDSLHPDDVTEGWRAVDFWAQAARDLDFPFIREGTLVVSHRADRGSLARFAHDLDRVPGSYRRIDRRALGELEGALGDRFAEALWVEGEAYLHPRPALRALARYVEAHASPTASPDWTVDCRGIAEDDADLRAIRGEIVYLASSEVELRHCVRLMHPRIALYIVPHGDGRYAVGATMRESSDRGPVTAGSLLELLSAATLVDPRFAEARVVETATGLRPTYPDHRPRVRRRGRTLTVNGLYRHGYLLSPALAEAVVATVTHEPLSSFGRFVYEEKP